MNSIEAVGAVRKASSMVIVLRTSGREGRVHVRRKDRDIRATRPHVARRRVRRKSRSSPPAISNVPITYKRERGHGNARGIIGTKGGGAHEVNVVYRGHAGAWTSRETVRHGNVRRPICMQCR